MNDTTIQLPVRRNNIGSSIAYLFSGTSVSQGLTAIALLFTARQLGPESYGQYSAALVFMGITSIFYNLGLNVWFIHESNRQPDRLSTMLGSALTIKFVFGVFWLLAIIGLSMVFSSTVLQGKLLRLTALVVYLDNLFLTFITAFKASLHNQLTSIFMTVSDVVWVILTIYLVRQGNEKVNDYMVMRGGVMLASVLVAGLFVLYWYKPKIVLFEVRKAMRDALPFAASEFLTLSAMRIDVLIVAFYLGKAAAGLYSPAVSLVNALFMPINAISLVYFPVLSGLFARDLPLAWKTARKSLWFHMGAGTLMTIGIVVGAKYLVIFLGNRFAGSLEILYILSSIILIHALIFGLTNILIATGQQNKRAYLQLVAVLLNVLINIAVVNYAGIRGVAYVYLLTETFLLISYAIAVMRNSQRGQPAHA